MRSVRSGGTSKKTAKGKLEMWHYLVAPLAVIALLATQKQPIKAKNGSSKRSSQELCADAGGARRGSYDEDGSSPRKIKLGPIRVDSERDCAPAEDVSENLGPRDRDSEAGVAENGSGGARTHTPNIRGDPDQVLDA